MRSRCRLRIRSTSWAQTGWSGFRAAVLACGRLTALLKYGAALTTTCVAAGVVTIWVKFESLDGIGTYAVTAAEPTEWFAAGASALLGTLFSALLTAGLLLLVTWVGVSIARTARTRSAWISWLDGSSRPVRAIAAQAKAHPWLAHAVLPMVLLALAFPDLLASPLPLALRIIAFLSAAALILAGFVRLLMPVVEWLDARPLTWLKPVYWTAGIAVFSLVLVSTTWDALFWAVLAAVWFVFLVRHASKHPEYAEMRHWDVVIRLRRPILAMVLATFVGGAIASEADRPSGLTLVRVNPASSEPFDAITVGQKQGRAAFLRLTSNRRIVRHGVIEFTPSALRTVDLNGPIRGPEETRPLWKRLSDWASTSSPVMHR